MRFVAASLTTLLIETRAKRAEDEPKCDQLRRENTAMTEQLIKYKETQHAFLEKLEKLKQEIETLLQHKVGSLILRAHRPRDDPLCRRA